MADIVLSLAPIFLLILLGLGLKRRTLVADAFWAPAEKLTYFVTFPALLVANLAKADLAALAWGPVAISIALPTALAGGLVLASRRVLGTDGPGLSSVFQGAIRPNTYVGLAGAAALYGADGVTLTAICIAAVVPLVNVLSVTALSLLNRTADTRPSAGSVLRGILTNPLILACVLGIALSVSGIGLPPVIGPFLEILGRAALPIGLLAVGAGLTFDGLRAAGRPVVAASAAKLLVLPAIAAGLSLLFGLDATALGTVVLYAGLPCSASSYVLARQMGGDAPMMAKIISLQTLVAMATLPLLLPVLGAAVTP